MDTQVIPPIPKGFVLSTDLNPEEAAANAVSEAQPYNDIALDKEIARAKGPAKGILLAEKSDRAQKSAQNADRQQAVPPIPEGFEPVGFSSDVQGRKQTMADRLYGKREQIVAEADVPVGDYVLNKAKVGLMAMPGLIGNIEQINDQVKSGFNAYIGMPPTEQPTERQKTVQVGKNIMAAVTPAASLANPLYWLEQGVKAGRKAIGMEGETAFPTSEELATKILGYDPKMKTSDKGTEFLGSAAEFGASMVGGPLGRVSQGLKVAAKSAGEVAAMSTAAAAGGQAAQAAFGEGPFTKTSGEVAAIVPFAWMRKWPSFIASMLTPEGRAAASASGATASSPITDEMKDLFRRQAEQQLRKGITEYPPAKTNIEDSTALQGQINEALQGTGKSVSLSAGRASDSPRIIADELKARRSSAANVAAALSEQQQNTEALLTYVGQGMVKDAPSRKAAIDRSIAEYNAKLAELRAEEARIEERSKKLLGGMKPDMTAEERGQKLLSLRQQEKIAEDRIKDQVYGLVKAEANRVGANDAERSLLDRSNIDNVADRLMANPLLQYDSTNMPSVIAKIKASGKIAESDVPVLVDSKGNPLRTVPETPPLIYDDVAAMRTSVNQDIAAELRSTSPVKRQRLRALVEVRDAIDGAVAESPYQTLRDLQGAANGYYKNTYSPKFNKGVNSKLTMTDSFGDAKVIDEKILSNYSSTVNNTKNFLQLFGKNPEALAVMEDHMLDKFSRAVIKDGVFDEKAHRAFMLRNGDVLKTLDEAGVGSLKDLNGVRSAVQRLSDRSATLIRDEERLANSALARMLGTNDHDLIVRTAMRDPEAMGRLTNALGEDGSKALWTSTIRGVMRDFSKDGGLDSAQFGKWLSDNQKPLSIMARQAFGAEGKEHLQRLTDVNKMLGIQERVPTVGLSAEQSTVGRDPIAQRLGFGVRQFFTMLRGVLTGRASEGDMAIALGGQAGSHWMTKTYNDLIASLASDPRGSKRLLELAKDAGQPLSGADATRNAKIIGSLLAKAGYYMIGGKFYGPTAKALAPGIIEQAASAEQ